MDRSTRKLVGWVVGCRDVATFKKLYEKVKHCKNCTFFTDRWEGFKQVLPPHRHIIGKSGTSAIERDNSNTRHFLARMTRRTKVVSKKISMVYDSIKLSLALSSPQFFSPLQSKALAFFSNNRSLG